MTERRDPSSVDLVEEPSLDAAAHDGAAQGLPAPSSALLDPRILAAWREWLAALATDAEAAIAAAHVYGELGPEAREAWLDVLAEDAPKLQSSCGGDLCAAPVGRERRRAPRADRGRDRGR